MNAKSLKYLPLWFAGAMLLTAPGANGQDLSRLGGDLTTDFPGRHAIQLPAPNVVSEDRRQLQLSGFVVFHQLFNKSTGLGPKFVNSSCGGCHVENGRGPTTVSRSRSGGGAMVVKVSLPGLQSDGAPRNVPGIGEQLQDRSRTAAENLHLNLQWITVKGKYPDGTRYKLRRPDLSFRIPGINQRKIRSSLRMTPAVIGVGLLEVVPDATLLAMSDPDDLNGDGISGKPNYIPDRRTGTKAIGRFGFKASHPTVEQQSAAALFHDIGITNALFPGADGTSELSDIDLDRLTVYQKIAGVPRAQNQEDPAVVAGKALFQQVNCSGCHLLSLRTETHPEAELSNQEFHPFTDLLLHDMGPGLADKRAEFDASGAEWRTTALWGLGFSSTLSTVRQSFLHDGRARTIEEAILWHGGEALQSREAFKALVKSDRANLIAFLRSL